MIDDISILKSSIYSSTPSPPLPPFPKSTKSSIDPVVEEAGVSASHANPHSSPPYIRVDILLPRSQLLQRRPMHNQVKVKQKLPPKKTDQNK
jgi:hypothetical protein